MTGEAHIVVDLGFGDSGKGTVTDHLVRATGAQLVVRFNGGAQAGHTVVLEDGRYHTFSQLGAGSFVPGVGTHLSRFMIVHPGGLLEEARVLSQKGVMAVLDGLSIDPDALVISPFQQAANRLREVLRGDERHGSCGLGIGETQQDALEFSEGAIRALDLSDPDLLRLKLQRLQQRKWELFYPHRAALKKDPQGALELAVLESSEVADRWIAQAGLLAEQVRIGEIEWPETVVLEGAQGVLLDEWRGFHPHTTWSRCTFANALELLQGWRGTVRKWGVLRAYGTRHGAGPFPTQDESLLLSEHHNATGPWQGAFRQGWLDTVLARYAIECCQGIDALALTHLDRVGDGWRLATGYEGVPGAFYTQGRLRLGTFQDLDYQQSLGQALAEARPCYEAITASRFIERLEGSLGVSVGLESWGPCPHHKRSRVCR